MQNSKTSCRRRAAGSKPRSKEMALCEGTVRGSVWTHIWVVILRAPELDTVCNFAPYCHLRILYIGGHSVSDSFILMMEYIVEGETFEEQKNTMRKMSKLEVTLDTNWLSNQPTNKSTNKPTNRSTNRPNSRPTNQPTNQTTNQPNNRPINRPTDRPTNRPTY
jgi:hypothetical protein